MLWRGFGRGPPGGKTLCACLSLCHLRPRRQLKPTFSTRTFQTAAVPLRNLPHSSQPDSRGGPRTWVGGEDPVPPTGHAFSSRSINMPSLPPGSVTETLCPGELLRPVHGVVQACPAGRTRFDLPATGRPGQSHAKTTPSVRRPPSPAFCASTACGRLVFAQPPGALQGRGTRPVTSDKRTALPHVLPLQQPRSAV